VRLAHADRGRLGQHPALGLVRGFRDAVDPVGQMDQRHVVQPRRQPVGLGRPARSAAGNCRARGGTARGLVLGRFTAAGAGRKLPGATEARPKRGRSPPPGQSPRPPHGRPSVTMRSTSAPVRISPPFSSISRRKASPPAPRAALHDRRARRLQREGDDLAHLAGIGAFGRQAGVQHPGRVKRLHLGL
jgi:hypothetical protein